MSAMSEAAEAEASAREWLRSVYGEDAAEEAMCVPWELRVELYPEVLRLGPCAAAVQEFFDAVVDAGGRTSLHLAFSDMWVELVNAHKDDYFLSGGDGEGLLPLQCSVGECCG